MGTRFALGVSAVLTAGIAASALPMVWAAAIVGRVYGSDAGDFALLIGIVGACGILTAALKPLLNLACGAGSWLEGG